MTKAIVSCIPYSHHLSITDLNYRPFSPWLCFKTSNPWPKMSSIGTPFLSRFAITFSKSFKRQSIWSLTGIDLRLGRLGRQALLCLSCHRLKSLRTCSFYLLGLRRALKVRIEIFLLYLKDIRRTNLLACWKWCIRRMFMQCSLFVFHLSYLWPFDRASSLISGENFELHLNKEEWVSVLELSTIWNMTKVLN